MKPDTPAHDVELVYLVEGEDSSRLVVIETNAYKTMRSLRQLTPSAHESGGVIIGERRGNSFVVKNVTTPSKDDYSSRFGFIRRFFHHQQAVITANKSSGGTSNYLGEWHTHPENIPSPSSIDFKNWNACLRRHQPCLVAIVGRHEEWWALYENGQFRRLRLLP